MVHLSNIVTGVFFFQTSNQALCRKQFLVLLDFQHLGVLMQVVMVNAPAAKMLLSQNTVTLDWLALHLEFSSVHI